MFTDRKNSQFLEGKRPGLIQPKKLQFFGRKINRVQRFTDRKNSQFLEGKRPGIFQPKKLQFFGGKNRPHLVGISLSKKFRFFGKKVDCCQREYLNRKNSNFSGEKIDYFQLFTDRKKLPAFWKKNVRGLVRSKIL